MTTTSGTITSVVIEYSFDGATQPSVPMTNTTGSTYEGSIPASTPANAEVVWNILATNSIPLTSTLVGDTYADEPFIGVTANVSSTETTVCENTTIDLMANLNQSGSASVASPTGTSSSSSASPFYHGYGGVKSQYIFRASEIDSNGLSVETLLRLI